MKPICTIETPFKEKFGIPRQSLLIDEAWGIMRFPKDDFYIEAFRGIEEFSHIWLIFSFHEAIEEGAKALVRPPRFLGKEKWGVFATRSPHRPNHLGLSLAKVEKVEILLREVVLRVSGIDLLDGTPIFDIKPYVVYADSVPEARCAKFGERPELKKVVWVTDVPNEMKNDERILIEKVIGLDPRPGFDQAEEFGVSVGEWNVRFRITGSIFNIVKCSE